MEKEKDGVWRTIRGRRVFIGKGESLGEAMSKSGKFNRSDIRETKSGLSQKDKFDRTNSQSLKQRQKAIKDFRKKDTRYSNSVYTTDRKDEKNRINENAHIEGSGQTRVQRNWNKYSEEDRREHRHELIQKKLADYKAKKRTNNGFTLAEEERIRKNELQIRNQENLNKRTLQSQNDKAKNEIEKFKAKKQSNIRDYKQEQKDLLNDMSKLSEEQLREYQGIFKEQGKNKFVERIEKHLQDRKQSNNKIDNDNNETFIQNTNMYGGTREYSKEDLKRMEEAGIRPMKESYTGGGWEGTKYNGKLETKEIAKRVTDEIKKKYPGAKISRKSDIYSGGSSIDFTITSTDKDIYASDKDIDKLSDEGLSRTIRDSIGGYTNFDDWLNKNNKKSANGTYTSKEQKEYLKEQLKYYKERKGYTASGNEWYLSDYGKNLISDLNKEANSYTYSDSDGMVDYFDHGTYMHIQIGKWDKPYQVNDVKAKVDAYKKRKDK